MSRDLFTNTFTARPAPRRSKWMIGASVLAHAVGVCALLIIPILSAADAYVLRASHVLVVSLPAPTPIPPTPPTPPPATQPVAPPIDPDVAPPAPPEEPVTSEVRRPAGASGPGLVTFDRLPTGPGIPGVPTGPGTALVGNPPPAVLGPVRPGGDIKAPQRTTYLAPVYPLLAKATGTEGRVILEATIDASGTVRDVRVLRSDPLFDRAAIDAVSRWRYTPTRLNGVAVPILLTVTVTFALK